VTPNSKYLSKDMGKKLKKRSGIFLQKKAGGSEMER
jgi:hypothetical protein